MSSIQETYILPTNGKLGDEIPEKVTLRNMTVADEKLILGSSGNEIDLVLKSCIVEPKNIDLSKLTSADKHFLLIKERIISYGNMYNVEVTCRHCGRTFEVPVDLYELDEHLLPDDFKEPYDTFELPVSKAEISLKIPRSADIDDVARKTKKYLRKFPEAKGDISYIYNLMTNIATVNGEQLSSLKLEQFLEQLPAKDSAYLKHRISKIKLGLDTVIYADCPNPQCGEEVEFLLPLGRGFFNSEFED